MTIYIDTDYKCHVSPAEGLTPIETDAFDGKCSAYIEGYRLVPSGQTWTRSDGVEFQGEMICPLEALERAGGSPAGLGEGAVPGHDRPAGGHG